MTAIYIIAAIAIWLFLAWLLVARRFPNDRVELNPWMWLVPFIPILYYLLFITGLVIVVIGISIAGLIHNLKTK